MNIHYPRPIMAEMMRAQVAATPIEAGEIKLDASVSVQFKIAPREAAIGSQ